MFLIFSKENIFGNHVVAKKRKWHWRGTYQIDLDDKVSNGVIKIEDE